MRINDTVSKDKKMNSETKSLMLIKIFGHNGAYMADTLCDLYLYIFTLYALNIPLLSENCFGLLLKLIKGTARIQFEEAIMDFQNQLL